ncbi:MAG: alpha/beta fold hydrolase [Actinomycetota bacterium]|nr:alpha/beta fold hydrolase [Actinomycetota bacterium]
MTTDKTETANRAAAAVSAGDPVASLDAQEVTAAAFDLLAPAPLLRESVTNTLELGKVLLGSSDVAPDARDKRFSDPTWQSNPFYKRVEQSYLLWSRSLDRLAEGQRDDYRRFRARSVARLLTSTLAPTNFLLGNPAAVKRAIDTGGSSLVKGARNLVQDVISNNGLPSQVDSSPYTLGENLAATPGAVVYRDEMFEVLQYTPTPTVRARPLLLIPPQVNKYYFLDLAPGRSLTEFLVGQGLNFFTVVWRNPSRERAAGHGRWGIDDYVAAQLRAIDVVRAISGSDDVNIFGACAGGLTTALMLAHLAALGDRRVHAASFAISMIDTTHTSALKLLATPRRLAQLERDAEQGKVYDADSVKHNFAWMRPDDLIFNYVVNNWLLGEDPPAFDVLAWNNDSNNLSARFDAEMLKLYGRNAAATPGALQVLGTHIDLSKVDCDTMVIAGMTDHITPWQPCYMTTQLLSGASEAIITSTGHIQTVVNPPGKARARYWHGPATAASPEEWLATQATEHSDSWWPRFAQWLQERSGDERPAPSSLGNAEYLPLDPAPGRYVRES